MAYAPHKKDRFEKEMRALSAKQRNGRAWQVPQDLGFCLTLRICPQMALTLTEDSLNAIKVVISFVEERCCANS
jgi:hypothetical protein